MISKTSVHRSRWREFSFAFHQLTQAIEPALSLSAMLKNWTAIVRGLAESPRQRQSQEERFKTS
jgi:hypothetical protein